MMFLVLINIAFLLPVCKALVNLQYQDPPLTEFPDVPDPNELVIAVNGNQLSSLDGKLDHCTGILLLSLQENEFTTFPNFTNFHGTIQKINLNNNQIEHICKKELSQLSGLQELTMNYNRLTEFPDLSEVAATLHTIRLSHNQIAFIANHRLNSLVDLAFLWIDNNQLTVMPIVTLGERFRHLRMHNNLIEEVPYSALQPTVAIRRTAGIYFENNPLSSIAPVCFNYTLNFGIEDTNIDLCACENLWLKRAREAIRIRLIYVTDVTCPGMASSWVNADFASLKAALCPAGTTVPDPCNDEPHTEPTYNKLVARYDLVASPSCFSGLETGDASNAVECVAACLNADDCSTASFLPPEGAAVGRCVLQVGGGATFDNTAKWQHFRLSPKSVNKS